MVCAAKVFVRGTGTKWGIGKGSEICIKIKIYIYIYIYIYTHIYIYIYLWWNVRRVWCGIRLKENCNRTWR